MESSEEAFEEASTSEAAFLQEILAINKSAGAKGASDDGLPIANHLYQLGYQLGTSLMDQGPSASFQGSQAAQGVTPSTRQNY